MAEIQAINCPDVLTEEQKWERAERARKKDEEQRIAESINIVDSVITNPEQTNIDLS